MEKTASTFSLFGVMSLTDTCPARRGHWSECHITHVTSGDCNPRQRLPSREAHPPADTGAVVGRAGTGERTRPFAELSSPSVPLSRLPGSWAAAGDTRVLTPSPRIPRAASLRAAMAPGARTVLRQFLGSVSL